MTQSTSQSNIVVSISNTIGKHEPGDIVHISEGVLSAPVLIGGATLTAVCMVISVRKLQAQDIPKTALLCAVFFLASIVRVPLGPGSAHLVLCGLMGALLGWGAFISIFVALLLQGMFFQFGGLTTLGVNTFNMGAPPVLCAVLLGSFITGENNLLAGCASFCIGFVSLLSAALLTSVSLYISGEHFLAIAQTLLAVHLPIAVVEGVVTAACVYFLRKVKPGMLPCGKKQAQS